MNKNLLSKSLTLGVVVLFIGIAVAPSINAITHKIPTRINCKDEVKSNTEVLEKTQEDEIDVIFNNMKKKLDNVNTQQECNKIFKETLIELDKCGLLGSISVDDAYKLVSSSANNENSYSVSGESSKTYFLESFGVYWYDIYKHEFLPHWKWIISSILWPLFLTSIKLPYHINSWITYGYAVGNWEGRIDWWEPAEGYIKIVSSQGEKEYNETFYGQIKRLDPVGYYPLERLRFHYVGIKGFKGWNIGDYYFGTAKEVNIGPDIPNPYYI